MRLEITLSRLARLVGGKVAGRSVLRRSSGFTLLELLVTVAIIGLLAALLLPASQKALTAARETKSLGNMRGIGHFCLIFAADHNGNLPRANDGDSNWFTQLKNEGFIDFKRDRKLLVCPLMDAYSGKLASNQSKATSYAMNAFLGPNADGSDKSVSNGINNLQSASRPSATALLFNSIYYPDSGGSWRTAATASASLNETIPADGKHVNVLFLDGSVSFLDSADSRLSKSGPQGSPEHLFWAGRYTD
ncbi:hypothetical protein BH09VER1_BH09VER1_26950 [soil metagenome]